MPIEQPTGTRNRSCARFSREVSLYPTSESLFAYLCTHMNVGGLCPVTSVYDFQRILPTPPTRTIAKCLGMNNRLLPLHSLQLLPIMIYNMDWSRTNRLFSCSDSLATESIPLSSMKANLRMSLRLPSACESSSPHGSIALRAFSCSEPSNPVCGAPTYFALPLAGTTIVPKWG